MCRTGGRRCPSQHLKGEALNNLNKHRRELYARNVKIKKKTRKLMPETAVLSPAKYDENGKMTKSAFTYGAYYEETDKKHFLDRKQAKDEHVRKQFLENPGSQFDPRKVNSLNHLVQETFKYRDQQVAGDDRDKMIEMGADPASFGDNYRYIITPVGGYSGTVPSEDLPDDTPLSLHEKVPGSGIASLTVERDEKPYVKYGTMVFADRSFASPDDPGDPGDEVVVTAHPGLPSRTDPALANMDDDEREKHMSEQFAQLKQLEAEGRLTVGEVRKLKQNDFDVNVKLRETQETPVTAVEDAAPQQPTLDEEPKPVAPNEVSTEPAVGTVEPTQVEEPVKADEPAKKPAAKKTAPKKTAAKKPAAKKTAAKKPAAKKVTEKKPAAKKTVTAKKETVTKKSAPAKKAAPRRRKKIASHAEVDYTNYNSVADYEKAVNDAREKLVADRIASSKKQYLNMKTPPKPGRVLSQERGEAVISYLQSRGIHASLASENKEPFYHELSANGNLPDAGKINHVNATEPSIGLPDKPKGALWLSPGDTDENGEVTTQWKRWAAANDYGDISGNGKTYEATFKPYAVIVELDEASYRNIPQVFNGDAEPHPKQEGLSSIDVDTETGKVKNTVDWNALREAGVHAVRVRGDRNRDHFYGWDADTVAILDGRAVKGWTERNSKKM